MVNLVLYFANSYRLCKYKVNNDRCVEISGRCYACMLTERDRESNKLRGAMSLQVKTSVCTWATIIKEARARMASITFTYLQLTLSSFLMIVAQVRTLVLAQSDTLASGCCFLILSVNVDAKRLPLMSTYHLLIGDLVLAKLEAVSKHLGKLSCLITCCSGCILHGHITIITKPSLHYVLSTPS